MLSRKHCNEGIGRHVHVVRRHGLHTVKVTCTWQALEAINIGRKLLISLSTKGFEAFDQRNL